MSLSPVRVLVLGLTVGATLAACGLKQDVKDQLAQGGVDNGLGQTSGGLDPSTGSGGSTTGTQLTTGGTTGVTGGATGSGTSGTTGSGTSGATGSGTSGATGSGTTGATSGSTGGVTGTRTGIDDKNKVIHIALHGPLTGAGVPQSSFTSGTPKYWANHKLSNGYSVEAVAIDDKYNAADGLRACNAAADKNFLIIGGAGTDQISACAQSPKLRRLHVPYLSSGVTEAGLGGISSYFATSLTYKEQSPLLIKLAKDKGYFGKKWGMVITGTPNFADARDSMVAELVRNGAKGKAGAFSKGNDVYLTDKAPSNCSTVATQIRGGGYEVVYFLGQPSFFAQCVGSIGNGGPTQAKPIYTGPGPSFGISSVITLACAASGNQYEGYYLHPAPSWNQRQKYGAPDNLTDDIEVGIWGGMQQLHQSLELVLKNGPLTRESFIQASQTASVPGGVLNPVSFTPTDHFGGSAAYANAAVCSSRLSNTIGIYRK
ncbi:MAG: ABC transporter substrate-binding protein [Actinomycetota bacterium]|nr:ABC transporter substrate-binding protein [Actinomycetota bacterium]